MGSQCIIQTESTIQQWMHAAATNNVSFIKTKMQSFVNSRDEQNRTALMLAAENGSSDAVVLLKEFELHQFDSNQQTALMHASQHGQLECAKLLVEEACMVDSQKRTALMHASISGHPNVVSFLEHFECNCQDSEGKTALMHSCIHGNYECAKLLLKEQGKQSYQWKHTALMFAAEKGCEQCVELLQSELNQTNLLEQTALMIALQSNQAGCAQLLLSECGKVDRSQKSALMYAAEIGQQSMVKDLREYEEGIVDKMGHTALSYAFQSRNTNCIKLLIQEANIVAPTAISTSRLENFEMCQEFHKQKKISIHQWLSAAEDESIEVLEQNIEQFRWAHDEEMKTALMYAATIGKLRSVNFLSKYEAGQQDSLGCTALTYACMNNHMGCAEALICEIDYNRFLVSPVQLAKERIEKMFGEYVKDKASAEKFDDSAFGRIAASLSRYVEFVEGSLQGVKNMKSQLLEGKEEIREIENEIQNINTQFENVNRENERIAQFIRDQCE